MRKFRMILAVSVMALCVTAMAMAGEILTGFQYATGSPENPISSPDLTVRKHAAMECMQTADLQMMSLRQGYFTITDNQQGATCFRSASGARRISSGVCVGVHSTTGATTQIRCDQVSP